MLYVVKSVLTFTIVIRLLVLQKWLKTAFATHTHTHTSHSHMHLIIYESDDPYICVILINEDLYI